MLPEPRASLFDLDDTLYPARRFVFSGFAAVARRLSDSDGLEPRHVLAVLRSAWKGAQRGRELQACLEHFALPSSRASELLAVMREHVPAMRLPGSSARTLSALRSGWRTGIVTNGTPAMQARKVAALGVGPMVDTVVFAHEHGTRTGKPDRVPFAVALERLGVTPERALFVGNDEACDIGGARSAGMRAILLRRVTEARRHREERSTPSSAAPSQADAVIESIGDLPRAVAEIAAS